MNGRVAKKIRRAAGREARKLTRESMEWIMKQGLRYRIRVAWGLLSKRMRWE